MWSFALLSLVGVTFGGAQQQRFDLNALSLRAAASSSSAFVCPSRDVKFELMTGVVYTAPDDMLDSRPGTLMLADCVELCRRNSTCRSANFETGLCVLFGSSADQYPGESLIAFLARLSVSLMTGRGTSSPARTHTREARWKSCARPNGRGGGREGERERILLGIFSQSEGGREERDVLRWQMSTFLLADTSNNCLCHPVVCFRWMRMLVWSRACHESHDFGRGREERRDRSFFRWKIPEKKASPAQFGISFSRQKDEAE